MNGVIRTSRPVAPRREALSRRPLPQRPRGRKTRQRPFSADTAAIRALYELITDGDVFEVGRAQYLVTPVDHRLMEEIAAVLGSFEEDEPSTGMPDDLEQDTGDDEPGGDDEASLGWSGISQHRLYAAVDDLESDGNCDAEDDDPDHGVDDTPHDSEDYML